MSKQLVYTDRSLEPEKNDNNDQVGKMTRWRTAKSISEAALNLHKESQAIDQNSPELH